MGDKYDEWADALTYKWHSWLGTQGQLDSTLDTLNLKYWVDLDNRIAAALRDAAAEGRRNAIEKSAELIGRQVEPRDA